MSLSFSHFLCVCVTFLSICLSPDAGALLHTRSDIHTLESSLGSFSVRFVLPHSLTFFEVIIREGGLASPSSYALLYGTARFLGRPWSRARGSVTFCSRGHRNKHRSRSTFFLRLQFLNAYVVLFCCSWCCFSTSRTSQRRFICSLV